MENLANKLIIASLAILTAFGGSLAYAAPSDHAGGSDVTASTSAVADYKQANDKDPHTALSAADQNGLTEKRAAAKRYYEAKLSGRGKIGRMAGYSANSRPMIQQPQQTYYYCGPAAVSMALVSMGRPRSQSSTASLLKTTTAGTAWSGVHAAVPSSTGYPVRDVLNYSMSTARYYPQALSYNPTTQEKLNYQHALGLDIDRGWIILANAWETGGGPHLVGHPVGQEIFHWYPIYGYTNRGSITRYADPASGGTGIFWGGGVPKYSSLPSDTITTINGGRGYVW